MSSLNKLKLILSSLSILFFSINLSLAETQIIFGSAEVTDGDTIKINKEKIRLLFIDAPELKQTCRNSFEEEYNCGIKSKEYLSSYINNQIVHCNFSERDRYKRILGDCFLKEINNSNINLSMIENGWAIIYRRYYFPKEFLDVEEKAKNQKKGLWQGKFLSPEQWRNKNK